MPRVVFQGIGPIEPGDNETVFRPFRDGLRELGYVEGRTIVFEFRHVNRDPERLPAAIEELARQGVDVILSGQPQVVLAAMRAAPTTPIVFAAIIDPVGAGIVRSLAKPGGNATGLAWDADPQITAKQL
jgi:putative ABC transport system substrate-binding protein